MAKTIYVVEDHAAFRGTLVSMLKNMEGIKFGGWSGDAEDALQKLNEAHPDLVLVDLSLPHMNGFEFGVEAKKRFPQLALFMLAGHPVQTYVERARSLGFQGYVVKGDTGELKSALRDVLQGKTSFPQ